MEGNFISPNFDSFKNTEVKIIMKTKGVAKEKLNLKDFKSLSHGNDFIVKTIVLPKTQIDPVRIALPQIRDIYLN